MKKIWVSLFFLLAFTGSALAQGNICRTSSPGSTAPNCASEDYVTKSISAIPPPPGGTVTEIDTSGLATGGPITSTGTVGVPLASKSDQQAGTSATTAVTPAHQQDHDSAAKAWAYCTNSSGTYTLQSSYNISGGTCGKTGTGSLTLTFTTAFANTHFLCMATDADAPAIRVISTKPASTTTVNVAIYIPSTLAFSDDDFAIVCYGRQ